MVIALLIKKLGLLLNAMALLVMLSWQLEFIYIQTGLLRSDWHYLTLEAFLEEVKSWILPGTTENYMIEAFLATRKSWRHIFQLKFVKTSL